MSSKELLDNAVVSLSTRLYREILLLPQMFGDFNDQALRSALSVGSNWCEAYGRSKNGKPQDWHCRIARGSGYELAFQLHAAGFVKLCKVAHKMCDLMDLALEAASVPSEPSKETENT